MDEKRIKKTVKKASITVAIAAGTVFGAVSYNSGNTFIPSLSNREYNFNQVHFDGDSDAVGKGDTNTEDDSAIFEKDNSNKPDNKHKNRSSSYLFDEQSEQQELPGQDDNTIGVSYDDTTYSDDNISTGGIYDIVEGGGTDTPDIIIAGGQTSDIVRPGDTTDTTGKTDTGNTSGNNGSSDNNNNSNTDYVDRSATAKDPEVEKMKPAISGSFDSKPYDEGSITDNKENIAKVVIQPDASYDAVSLYKGQSVDAYTIFCMLDTYVVKMENDNAVLYLWGKEAYNKYIRVNGVSFDGGESWNTDFPVTIPEDIDNDIIISVDYRLSADDDWTNEGVEYTPKDNRIFVLSDNIKNDNETITDNMIINYDQYPDVGSLVNLYKYQLQFIKDTELKYLFAGWTENGKLVPWIYKAQTGRHILQPSAFIPLDDKYRVVMRNVWMTDDGVIDTNGNNYCAVQTLTGLNDSVRSTLRISDDGSTYSRVLDVPMYVQAVELEEELDVDYVNIPETVIFVKNEGTGSNLKVSRGYEVSKDNLRYTSKDGLLMSKDKTQIIAVPYTYDNLVIDEYITRIILNTNNNISNLILKATTMDEMPELDYTYLDGCTITVDGSILDDYLSANYANLSGSDNVVTTSESPQVTYRIRKGVVVNNEGELYKIIGETGTSVTLTDDIKSIGSETFDEADSVNKLILSENCDITLREDSLKNSNIDTILCRSDEQKKSIEGQLSYAGNDGIAVYVLSESSDGFMYYSVHRNGADINILVKAPAGITQFNGTIENDGICINQIDDECFAECDELEWVILPEYVTDIGYEAFMNCTALQGILIQTKDTITIGNKAFDGCDGLRFIASDAMNAVMREDYDPVITDQYSGIVEPNRYFFILDGASGYGENTNSVSSISGIEKFRLVSAGGSYMLYGADYYGDDFVLLRSGKDISGEVELSGSLMYIYNYALADAGIDTGYTINWDELVWLFSIQKGAFCNSGLSGDISINAQQGILLYDNVFAKCSRIANMSIEGNIYYLGEQMFNGCTSLESVKLGYIDDWTGCIHSGIFTGCDNLRTIQLDNYYPIQLLIYEGTGFQFNNEWTRAEEAEKLKIIVPEGTQEDYLYAWRYFVCGYTGTYTGSPYIDMWNDIQSSLIDWDSFTLPDDSEVDRVLSETLLEAENYLRQLLDMTVVSVPTELYTYRLSDEYITLAGVPKDTTVLDMTMNNLGLPSGWYVDYIGEGALAGADSLEKVVIADNLVGIYNNAFKGAAKNTGKLTLEFTGYEPVQLICDAADLTFSFGIDNSNITIIVPEGAKDIYMQEWSVYINADELDSMIIEMESEQYDS